MQAFIYLWRDRARNMYYIGSHVGTITDCYLSSSNWLNGEIKYRPKDFRRRILKVVPSELLKREEYRLIKMIEDSEFGVRYYNIKGGRKKGTPASNKGKPMSLHQRQKLSEAMRGCEAWNLGKPNPVAAINGIKSAEKNRLNALGRRLVQHEGKRRWAYPSEEGWYLKEGERKVLISSP